MRANVVPVVVFKKLDKSVCMSNVIVNRFFRNHFPNLGVNELKLKTTRHKLFYNTAHTVVSTTLLLVLVIHSPTKPPSPLLAPTHTIAVSIVDC